MSSNKYCVIDAEGDVGNKGLLGVAFYSDEFNGWITDHEEIKTHLEYHAQERYTFVAHNASYDIPVIFWQLKIPVEVVYYNDRFNCGRWVYDPKKPAVEIWDSYQMSGNLPLEQLGKSIGLPKLPTPQRLRGIDADKFEWKCDNHGIWECEQCYAIRDAEIVYRFMVSFSETIQGWGCKVVRKLPGNSINVWKQLDNPFPIELKNQKVRTLGRQAYYGGRVETFKLGTIEPVYTADVTSMYPSVMVECNFPDPQDMCYLTDCPLELFDHPYEGVAEVDITVPFMYVPPLPFAHNGERVFGYGELRGSWTLFELRYAISLGCTVTHIHQAAFSIHSLKPFDNFIGTLWELRESYKKNDDPRQVTAKILMNSLYGRIGMNVDVAEPEWYKELPPEFLKSLDRGNLTKEVVFPMPKGAKVKDYPGCTVERIGDDLFVSKPMTFFAKNPWANVIWAAQITSAARVKLHKYMLLQGSNLVYCDTDSIFSTQPIAQIGEGLGALRLDGEYTQAKIIAPKLYSLYNLDGTVLSKAKGVPRHLADKFIRGEEVIFQAPIKPKSQFDQGIAAGTWVDIKRTNHLVPNRRVPVNPPALLSEGGFSDTLPMYISLE